MVHDKKFYSRPYKIETVGVYLVACGYEFTGICVFGAFRKVASVLALAGLRVKRKN